MCVKDSVKITNSDNTDQNFLQMQFDLVCSGIIRSLNGSDEMANYCNHI